MKTVEEAIIEIETKHGVRFYGKEKEMISEALRQWGEEIREEAAKRVEKNWLSSARFRIAEDIRSIDIK